MKSSTYNTVDLNQTYDVFGNMTAQTATRHGGATNTLPFGLEFSGRTYADNKISNSGFAFDANGNLVSEPAHDGLAAQSYQFNPDGRLVRVTDGAGKSFQSAAYEGDSHRWFRSTWAEGSKALITLRDASGKVVADFMESNATSGLELQKEYIHANGQLLAINSTCGPRPALRLSDPATINGQVWFDKTDYVTAEGTYTIAISTDFGQSRTLTRPANLANHFGIAQSEFWQGVTNYVSIETDAACGHTGYSNAVSYVYAVAPQNGSCLTSVGASRTGFNGSGSSIEVGAQGSCATGTVYNVYFQRAGTLDVVKLNAIAPLSAPKIQISNVPCGSGEGDYWLTPIAPETTTEGPASPKVTLGSGDCGGGGDPGEGYQPGRASVNLQFVHTDHLGSTRAVTDEHGVLITAFKYFPFGMEAEASGDEVRQRFTGHERDDRVGLDYMMARSCRAALGRFIQPDMFDASGSPSAPQSWNRYAYVDNSPINSSDPSGRLLQRWVSTSPALGNLFGGGHSGAFYHVYAREQPENSGQTESDSGDGEAKDYRPAPPETFGSCDWYHWREANAPQSYKEQSGPSYFLKFGAPMCEKFDEAAASDSTSGELRTFIRSATLILEIKLENAMRTTEGLSSNRGTLYQAAISTHSAAYREAGFASLSCSDQYRVVQIIGSAWLSPGSGSEIARSLDLGMKCFIVPTLLLPLILPLVVP